ncbi:lipopolysaccharide biosynthesis protein [Smaragdicoccus niigatensis]|uniref:lipopolysaccharide biosynthesis protein n=1 Tax=Smaragdicoccus niigatensis TaxID=359359 RepID=UPI0003680D2D|nr:oligosaccharide flippase family protein [Smaragdicoccus niigatensis]
MNGIARPKWRLAADSLNRVGARMFAALLQAGFLLVLARAVGPTDLGAFSVVYSATLVAATVLGFGASTRILRISSEDEPELTANALTALRLVGLIAAIPIVLTIVDGFFNYGFAIVLAGTVVGASDQLAEYVLAKHSGNHRNTRASVVIVAQRLLLFGGLVAGLSVASLGVWGGLVLSAILATMWTVVELGTVRFVWRDMRALARSSVGYLFSSAVSSANQLEIIVLQPIASAAIAGQYALASRLMNPLTMCIAALQSIAIPELARADGPKRSKVRRVVLLSGIGYGAVLVLLSPVIVAVVLRVIGSEYDAARALLYAVVVSAALSSVAQMINSVLISEGRPGIGAINIAIGRVLAITLLVGLALSGWQDYIWIALLTAHGTVLTLFVVGFRVSEAKSAISSIRNV